MIKRSIVIMVVTVLALARPMLASAQQGATVGGVLAATSIGSRTEASVAGAVGYRMNRFLGFGLELTSIPTLKPEAAAENASGTDGQATVFTANVHVELPAVTARFIPYVVGGGGGANIKETFALQPAVPPGIPVVIAPQAMTRSSTDLALTAGGGVSLLAGPRVSIDVDLRYLRLMADRDRNVGRFGVGVSYRF
jgi:opacity protein-like surface antigen